MRATKKLERRESTAAELAESTAAVPASTWAAAYVQKLTQEPELPAKCSECGAELTPETRYVDDLCRDCMQDAEENEEARMLDELDEPEPAAPIAEPQAAELPQAEPAIAAECPLCEGRRRRVLGGRIVVCSCSPGD